MPEKIIEILLADEEWPDYVTKLKRKVAMRRRKRTVWDEMEGAKDNGKYTGSDQPTGWEDNM